MKEQKIKPLEKGSLRKVCDPAYFDFETTEELSELTEFIGQTRAVTATRLGIEIKQEGFNIFALGPVGIGKRSVVRSLLKKETNSTHLPKDICYIHNFHDPKEPLVLLLDAGMGRRLADDMQQLIEILRISIPAIFENKDYAARIKELQEETRHKQDKALEELEKEAEQSHLTILRTAQGFMLAALKENGEMYSDEEFARLPKADREQKEAVMRILHEHLTEYLESVALWQKELREQSKEVFKYFTMLQVGSIIDELKNTYKDQPAITAYLNHVQTAILDNPSDFRKRAEVGVPSVLGPGTDESAFNRYRVNVLVDHSKSKGAPIIHEDNPTYVNLVGKIEQVSHFGAFSTDFTLITAGALHKANGGYLLLDARKLLMNPYAWEGLKRALRAKEIKIENIYQMMGFMGGVSLEPKPVPLDVKIILFGERSIYYLLCSLDPDFLDLFKVAADFNEEILRTKENNLLFARLLTNLVKKDKLRPLDKEAVARTIDYASRIIEDSKKLSTHVQRLRDLLHEADHYAMAAKRAVISCADIEHTIDEQHYRASRFKERMYENIERGVVLIDTTEEKIGQINGLSYVALGSFAFGMPTRITARISLGKGQLIDIEREVKLGGPIHSKGVLILTGYLSGHFARTEPWALSASLVFEQSYGGVEGDSASVAEACALLSAIAEIPIKQSMAITGSLNQHGQVQAIGGVNEKIEGFFDICQAQGLSGKQGVVIPSANVDRLMLRKDVVEACAEGKFHIYAVSHIDEALTIMTGIEAGARDAKGKFPKDSVNGKVEAQLIGFAERIKALKS